MHTHLQEKSFLQQGQVVVMASQHPYFEKDPEEYLN